MRLSLSKCKTKVVDGTWVATCAGSGGYSEHNLGVIEHLNKLLSLEDAVRICAINVQNDDTAYVLSNGNYLVLTISEKPYMALHNGALYKESQLVNISDAKNLGAFSKTLLAEARLDENYIPTVWGPNGIRMFFKDQPQAAQIISGIVTAYYNKRLCISDKCADMSAAGLCLINKAEPDLLRGMSEF